MNTNCERCDATLEIAGRLLAALVGRDDTNPTDKALPRVAIELAADLIYERNRRRTEEARHAL